MEQNVCVWGTGMRGANRKCTFICTTAQPPPPPQLLSPCLVAKARKYCVAGASNTSRCQVYQAVRDQVYLNYKIQVYWDGDWGSEVPGLARALKLPRESAQEKKRPSSDLKQWLRNININLQFSNRVQHIFLRNSLIFFDVSVDLLTHERANVERPFDIYL